MRGQHKIIQYAFKLVGTDLGENDAAAGIAANTLHDWMDALLHVTPAVRETKIALVRPRYLQIKKGKVFDIRGEAGGSMCRAYGFMRRDTWMPQFIRMRSLRLFQGRRG